MIERFAEVIGQYEGRVRLKPERAPCSGCESGCGGRCQLLPLTNDGSVWLPRPEHRNFAAGERVVLSIEESALASAAWRGYGVVLIGLLGGALAGAGTALWLLPEPWRDATTLIGLLAGTFLAARLSKRHRIEPQLRSLDS